RAREFSWHLGPRRRGEDPARAWTATGAGPHPRTDRVRRRGPPFPRLANCKSLEAERAFRPPILLLGGGAGRATGAAAARRGRRRCGARRKAAHLAELFQ